ncbi:MAG TPA: hypothetical protein VN840_15230, partial [Streptosporangiaceae bacterium]|nr:hypothetical protein [Streptosporangiaceae bacterium]
MNSAGAPDQAQNWYSVLGLAPAATGEEITEAVERLTRQASALALTAPERSRQLREQARAIKRDLLSGEAERQRYDQELARRSQAGAAQAAQAGNLAAAYPPPGTVPPGQAYPPPGTVPPPQGYPPPGPVPPAQANPPPGTVPP